MVSSDTEKDRGKQRVLREDGVHTREASAPAVLSQARRSRARGAGREEVWARQTGAEGPRSTDSACETPRQTTLGRPGHRRGGLQGPGRGGQGSDTHRGDPGGHGEEMAVRTPRREASGGPALPAPGSGVPASRPGDVSPAVSVARLCFAFAGAGLTLRDRGQVLPPPLGALATAAHSVLEPTACRLPTLGSALASHPPSGALGRSPVPGLQHQGQAAGLAKASGGLTALPRGSRLRAPAHQSRGPPEGKGRVDSRSIIAEAWPPHQRSERGAFVDRAVIPQAEAEGGLAVTVLSGHARDIVP
ncbi:unnamed protein product [Rangifer tarandus platyrhynchus]|uniref:Uncharacterized protein n=2 Tax=Rangifer tarandus platyrhynchus TaxID=3082113 RepID=A0ABN8Z0M9_RANTA|nr:unnamed protein product [Rangifer tarandus platyrhynchus]CAI9704899.1 unnamed protein product [Rangifer tarandus platyrhynchus]